MGAVAFPALAPHKFWAGAIVHCAFGLFAVCAALAGVDGCGREGSKVAPTYGESLAQQGRSGPKNRRLAVEITCSALALVVVLQIILLSGTFADAGQIVVLVDVSGDGIHALRAAGP